MWLLFILKCLGYRSRTNEPQFCRKLSTIEYQQILLMFKKKACTQAQIQTETNGNNTHTYTHTHVHTHNTHIHIHGEEG